MLSYWVVAGLGFAGIAAMMALRKRKAVRLEDETWESHVKPHGSLRNIAPFLWEVTAPGERGPSRNMTVYRMKNGGLLLHSVIAMNETEMERLEAMGPPEIMVVPNGFHRMDCNVYKRRYPKLRVLAPRGAMDRVRQRVPVDAALEDEASRLRDLGVEVITPRGIKPVETMLSLEIGKNRESRALVVCDSLFNMEPDKVGFLGRYVFGLHQGFGMTRLGRFLMLKSGAEFAAFLRELAALPNLAAICVAHGLPVTDNCALMLRQAAAKLDGKPV